MTELREADAAHDPLTQFELWYEEARAAVEHPETMVSRRPRPTVCRPCGPCS